MILNHLPFISQFAYAKHSGSKRTSMSRIPISDSESAPLSLEDVTWEFALESNVDSPSRTLRARLAEGNDHDVAIGLSLIDEQWTTDNYVLIPGAVYNGNRSAS